MIMLDKHIICINVLVQFVCIVSRQLYEPHHRRLGTIQTVVSTKYAYNVYVNNMALSSDTNNLRYKTDS